MKFESINFQEKLELFDKYWTPKIIAQMNDYQFKLVKIQGEFVWHSHAETDEVFIVLAGEMAIEMRHQQKLYAPSHKTYACQFVNMPATMFSSNLMQGN